MQTSSLSVAVLGRFFEIKACIKFFHSFIHRAVVVKLGVNLRARNVNVLISNLILVNSEIITCCAREN